ncbi:hypothetical protein VCRA2110O318_20265 [Vibrio crassostreae]|nr:hypothetical protein VCRA2117O328_10061 [Vibrio crassostreae]CAK2320327.1 hypothetical protein VCRA2110O318_20265 [Vibrio crassostreae]CAK2490145.1 hypothetical protein VCRA2110O319_30287 [Vibrio crassostreae]CAK2835865.1 hypothetical protein VCRA217O317_20060 [Vibrio crassostreae]
MTKPHVASTSGFFVPVAFSVFVTYLFTHRYVIALRHYTNNMTLHSDSVAQNWQLYRIKMTHVSIHGIKIVFSEPRNCNITTISKR